MAENAFFTLRSPAVSFNDRNVCKLSNDKKQEINHRTIDQIRFMVAVTSHDAFTRLIDEDAAEALDDIIANRVEELRLIEAHHSTDECFLGERALRAFTRFFNPRYSGYLSLILWFLLGLGVGFIVHQAKLLPSFFIICLTLVAVLMLFPR